MNWTTTTPTEPGWYWYREEGRQAEVVYLILNRLSDSEDAYLMILELGQSDLWRVDQFIACSKSPEWMGPLTEPK